MDMVKAMYEITNYPKFYFQRGKQSDKDWIMSRMCRIPPDRQSEIAREYEARYLLGTKSQGRRIANTYLQQVAKEFYDKDNLQR